MREPCLKEKGGIAARQVSKLNARASLKEKGASLHINFQS